MNDLINNSQPDELRKIAKKIDAYADNLKGDMKKLMQTHQGMHKCWSGKQYDDFSHAIEEANRVIKKQADNLLQISESVKEDAKQLEISLKVSTK